MTEGKYGGWLTSSEHFKDCNFIDISKREIFLFIILSFLDEMLEGFLIVGWIK